MYDNLCTHCNTKLLVLANESSLGCPTCGRKTQYMQSTSAQISYGDEVEFSVFSYKRANHFCDWLLSFQAKETTVVHKDIINSVMDQLYLQGIEPKDVTRAVIKNILRDLRLDRYYNNTSQICTRITGKLPPRMIPYQEKQAKLMFQAIQEPFEKYRPANRRNFLSYAYVLYKFCQLMGWDQFLSCFTLLKSAEKLQAQDDIYRKICAELDWEYIETGEIC